MTNEFYPKGFKPEVRFVGVAISDKLEEKRQAEAIQKLQKPVSQIIEHGKSQVFEETVMLQRLTVGG